MTWVTSVISGITLDADTKTIHIVTAGLYSFEYDVDGILDNTAGATSASALFSRQISFSSYDINLGFAGTTSTSQTMVYADAGYNIPHHPRETILARFTAAATAIAQIRGVGITGDGNEVIKAGNRQLVVRRIA